MKRLAIMAVMIMIFCGLARASAACAVNMAGVHALADEAGDVLVFGEGVDGVFEVRANALYAVGTEGNWALCDDSGRMLTEAGYGMFRDAGDCVIFRQGSLYGAMDDAGNVLVGPEWTQLVDTGDGGFLALMDSPLDSQADEIFYLSSDGTVSATGAFTASGLRAFVEGRMAFSAPDGRWGYLDAQGYSAIPSVWMAAGDFADGAAIVSDGEGFGLIDAEGEWLVAPGYGWMARSGGAIAALAFDGGVDVFSPDGRTRLCAVQGPVEQVYMAGDCVCCALDGWTRVFDASGECVLEASSDAMVSAGLDGQLIVADGEWGSPCQRLVNPDGTAASGAYQRILPLCAGRYAFLTISGAEYYSEELGRMQTSWDYGSVRYGLMDAGGRELLPASYREIRAAGEDRLLLDDGERVALADPDGHELRTWDVTAE